jgi:hypothetical protein
LFQKRIYSIFLGTLVGKQKQTIFEKRWFDITNMESPTPCLDGYAESPSRMNNMQSRDSPFEESFLK